MPDDLSLPRVENTKEQFINHMVADSAMTLALILEKKMVVGLVAVKSAENAYFFASTKILYRD
jgi:hypothetical protein